MNGYAKSFEAALEAALVGLGHPPLQVSLLVYGADDITDRITVADPALAEAYLTAINREEAHT